MLQFLPHRRRRRRHHTEKHASSPKSLMCVCVRGCICGGLKVCPVTWSFLEDESPPESAAVENTLVFF